MTLAKDVLVERVSIPKEYYEELVRDSQWLSYLMRAGVDNWQGYAEAEQMREDDDIADAKRDQDISMIEGNK